MGALCALAGGKGRQDWRKYFAPPTGTTPAQFGRWNIPEELHYNTWIAERTNAISLTVPLGSLFREAGGA